MMKIKRGLFAACTLILLLAGLYSGDYIYYIGFGVLISILIYAIATNLWVLLDFNYLQTISPNKVSKGQNAILTIQIHNDKPFIFPFMKIYYQTPASILAGTTEKGVLSILPFQHGEIREEFNCSLRGNYQLGITHLEVGDMFGLFRFPMNLMNKHYHRLQLLSVYPRIIHLAYLPLPQIQLEGILNNQLLRTNEAATLSDIRQYRYGDPLKKIHWKASSKLQELQVMNHEMTTQPHALLFVETTPNRAEGMERHQIEDQIIETTTAIAHYILHKWLPLKFVIYHETRKELNGRNPQDFQAFYEQLSNISFDSLFPMTEIMQMESTTFHQRGSLILIIHELSYTLFSHLCIFKQTGVYPMIFLIQHRNNNYPEYRKMIEELNEKGIPSFLIFTDQRIDEALEAVL